MVAAIAEIELSLNLWPELIRILLENVTNADNPVLKQSTLQALGYVCEATVNSSLYERNDE